MNKALATSTPSLVQVTDMADVPWEKTDNPALWMKTVRRNDELGHYLGLLRFDAFAASGLHQHQGVATSFVADGGLTDYHGAVGLHQVGINFKGSTHDAIAYQNTILVSRLEGPVSYPANSLISGVHAGSRYADFANPDVDAPPEVNVSVDCLPHHPTGFTGVRRQTIFDYAGTGSNHRLVQLTVRPQSAFAFEATALTEFWVRGGLAEFNGQTVRANSFVCCQPGARVELQSAYGILLLGWVDGPPRGEGNLFGF